MKTTHSMIKRILLVGAAVMALNVHAQNAGTIASPPSDLVQKVDLSGSYQFEDARSSFWLTFEHDRIAYPLDDVQPQMLRCETTVEGEYCQPIAISPPTYDMNRYIAGLHAADCWGHAIAQVSDTKTVRTKITKRIRGQVGSIEFDVFTLNANVGIIPVYSQVQNGSDVAVSELTGSSGTLIKPISQCLEAQRAADLLERVVEFRVTKKELQLRTKKGRLLRLKRVDLVPLPM